MERHAPRFYAGSKYEAICLKKKELRPAASALGQLRISSLSGPNYARICTDVTATFKRLQAEGDEGLRRRGDPIPRMSQLGQGRRSRAAVRGSAMPEKADQPVLQSIISSVPKCDLA